jgi:hypothetical protein
VSDILFTQKHVDFVEGLLLEQSDKHYEKVAALYDEMAEHSHKAMKLEILFHATLSILNDKGVDLPSLLDDKLKSHISELTHFEFEESDDPT